MNDLQNSFQDDDYNEAKDRELQRSVLSSKYLEKISTMIEHGQCTEAMQHLDKLLKALSRPLNVFKNDHSREFASLDYILPLTVRKLTECIYSAANSEENCEGVIGLGKLFSKVEVKNGEKVEKEQPGKVKDERFLKVIHSIEDFLGEKEINFEFENARFYSLMMAGICEKLIKFGKTDSIPNCELNSKIFMRRQFKDPSNAKKTWNLLGLE